MKDSFQIGKALDAGKKRRDKPNQDSIGMAMPGFLNRRPPILILSDGMGGYGGGEIASQLAVKTLIKIYRRNRIATHEDYSKVLRSGIEAAHNTISQQAKRSKDLEWMGCTIVAAILTNDEIHIANVGDSRAYLVTPGDIVQLSYDHSVVADQVRQGLITELEARHHPKRNVLSLSLTGRRESVTPFLDSFKWSQEDNLLLCSDGLWGAVTEAQIHSVVLELDPQQASEKLVQMANTNGGPDNISVIIARHARTQMKSMSTEDDTGPGF